MCSVWILFIYVVGLDAQVLEVTLCLGRIQRDSVYTTCLPLGMDIDTTLTCLACSLVHALAYLVPQMHKETLITHKPSQSYIAT